MNVDVIYTGKGKDPFLFYVLAGGPPVLTSLRFSVAHSCKVTVCATHPTSYGQTAVVMEHSVELLVQNGEVILPCGTARCSLHSKLRPYDSGTRAGATRLTLEGGETSPSRASARARLKELMERNMRWTKSLKPHSKVLRYIQIPRFNGNPHVPGWAFMLTSPAKRTLSAAFVENALRIILHRRRTRGGPVDAAGFRRFAMRKRAMLVAEMLQAVSNHIIYITDYHSNKDGSLREVDCFSDMARVLGSGDCEDTAKEIIMLVDEIRHADGFAPDSLAEAVREVLDQYIFGMTLGSVRGKKLTHNLDEAESDTTTTVDGDRYSLNAHAYIMMMPKAIAMHLCGVGGGQGEGELCRVPHPRHAAPVDESLNHILTLDGTNLKIVEERPDYEPHPGQADTGSMYKALNALGTANQSDDRFKVYGKPSSNYYVDVVSMMTRDVLQLNGAPACQLYFTRGGGVYGVPFSSLVNDRTVRMWPTTDCSLDDIDLIKDELRFEPNVDVSTVSRDDVKRVYDLIREAVAGGAWARTRRGFSTGSRTGHDCVTMFISREDCAAPDIIASLEALVERGEVRGVSIHPEVFSAASYGAQVVFHR